MTIDVTTETTNAAETTALGRRLAAQLKPGDVVAFFGDLGAGKTTMIKGIAAWLGVDEVVRSPSFVVSTEYDGRLADRPVKVHHLDLYRLKNTGELTDIGFIDNVNSDDITLIEWADRAGMNLPAAVIRVTLEVVAEDRRSIRIESVNPQFAFCNR